MSRHAFDDFLGYRCCTAGSIVADADAIERRGAVGGAGTSVVADIPGSRFEPHDLGPGREHLAHAGRIWQVSGVRKARPGVQLPGTAPATISSCCTELVAVSTPLTWKMAVFSKSHTMARSPAASIDGRSVTSEYAGTATALIVTSVSDAL
jgi:hypothetical protein